MPLHCGEARAALAARAGRLAVHARRAVLDRARHLAHLSRAPAEHVARERAPCTRRCARCARAPRAGVRDERAAHARARGAGARRARAAAAAAPEPRPAAPRSTASPLALAAHDPERVVERGYAVVDDRAGDVLTSAEAARAAGAVRLRFADAAVDARIEDDG